VFGGAHSSFGVVFWPGVLGDAVNVNAWPAPSLIPTTIFTTLTLTLTSDPKPSLEN